MRINSPFDLKKEEILEFTGPISDHEMMIVKAVLNGVKRNIHIPMDSGMKHDDMCWSFGPTHYLCAYNKVREMAQGKPPMPYNKKIELYGGFSDAMTVETFLDIVRRVENHHNIGLST